MGGILGNSAALLFHGLFRQSGPWPDLSSMRKRKRTMPFGTVEHLSLSQEPSLHKNGSLIGKMDTEPDSGQRR
jgi:hypothetical protein